MKSGIRTPKLRFLRPLLQRWIGLNDALTRRWADDPDVPWWYNERASVSVFAGAVWQTKGHAFEEYAGSKKREKEDCSGRYDLEFSVRDHDFRVEAKQCWLRAGRRHDFAKCAADAIEQARADVRRCPSWGMRKLAIVFGVPSVRASRADLPAHIDRFIEQAKHVDADAAAWCFPQLRKLPRHEHRVYPGVVVWIKKVGR